VLDAQIPGQLCFQLLMERPAVGKLTAFPDLLKVWDEVLKRRQQRARDWDRFAHGFSLLPVGSVPQGHPCDA
jgi:hypothetical protein